MNEEKKWGKVAGDIGYSTSNKNIPSLLRAHYERILYPLDVFEREEQKKAAAREVKKEENVENGGTEEDEKEYQPHNIPARMKGQVPVEKDKAGRRSKRYGGGGGGDVATPTKDSATPKKEVKTEDGDSAKAGGKGSSAANSFSKELARLQFFGAGPKMAGLPTEKTVKEKSRNVKMNLEYDPVSSTTTV